MAEDFEATARFEHKFWLQILGDHARFIHDSLSPKQKEEIQSAQYFINFFDRLLDRVDTTDLVHLSLRADEEASKIREFKLDLLKKLLLGKVTIHLSPTFINHMVNELDEYIRILQYLKRGETPPVFHELHHHLVWLPDAVGHAGAIHDRIDYVEKKIKSRSLEYLKQFEEFYLKAVEMTGYLRANLSTFPALERFNQEISLEFQLFKNFLHEIEELKLSEQALGTFAPLMADHMAREECYYLTKLAQSTEQPVPHCNPAKPRTEKP